MPTTENFTGAITRRFIYNRPLSILVLIGSIVAGLLSFILTPKQYNPEVVLPAFQVTVPYPGATASEVETNITLELEENIQDIPGVEAITSRSLDGGVAILGVEFAVGEDLEMSKVKLQSKVTEASQLLPETVSPPQIKNINPDDVPIVTLGIYDENLSQNQLRIQAQDIVTQLRTVEGIANIQVHGGQKKTLRVLMDPDRMTIRKVSPSQVEQAIQANNLRVPAGSLRNGEYIRDVEIHGTIDSAQTLGEIMVAPGVRVADIATVEEGFAEKNGYVHASFPDKPIEEQVFISFAKRKGTNAITVADTALEKMDTIVNNPDFSNLSYAVYRNDGVVASEAISSLGSNLMQSIIIVGLVLMVFLGLRSALLVVTAIPLTLALVFFSGSVLGESINRITLFALILSLGLLVDSATVVVENIYRHAQKGKDLKEAIITAVNEVGIGLLLSTITSIIVFVPTSQISGMMGEYMGPLSLFVPLALLFSLLVAYILIPFLADLSLSQKSSRKKKSPAYLKPISKRINSIQKRFFANDPFEVLSKWYGKELKKLLDNPKKSKRFLFGVFGLLAIVFTFPVLQLVHFRMLPTADKEQFYVYVDAPEGYDLEKTAEISLDLEETIVDNPQVVSIQSFVGEPPVVDFNGMYKGAHMRQGFNIATLRVNLTHPSKRRISSEEIVKEVRLALSDIQSVQEYKHDGGTITLLEDPPGPPVFATFMLKVKSANDSLKDRVTNGLTQTVANTDGVVDTSNTIETAYFKTIYQVDHQAAQQVGIVTADVVSALRTGLSGSIVGEFHLENHNETAFIELQYPLSRRDNKVDFETTYIKSQRGYMVPLESVVTEVESRNIPMILRDEGESSHYITAEMQNRSVVYAMIDVITDVLKGNWTLADEFSVSRWNVFELKLTHESGETVTLDWGGEWEMTLENFRDLGMAMMVAFVLVYAVLVTQFKSFVVPALVMTTIPLAFVGILPGFAVLDLLNGTFLTATSLIGFIALMGIVVNNAILFLEYFDQQRAGGMSTKKALVLAGKTRLRPIMLTSMTTVLGSLTIAGDAVWSGLAWSIVFGLTLSAVLTLGVLPILYALVIKE